MPISSTQRAILAGLSSILMPSVSTTSADPHSEVTLRLPCLATRTPAPATANAVAVDMLNVPLTSPPVPQVSTSASRSVPLTSSAPASVRNDSSGAAADRMASANPTISSTDSPFMFSATSSPAICASVASPRRISAITALASSRVSDSRHAATRCRQSPIMANSHER